jgi:diguanylate cyclase (GGDEF)-like protein
MSKRYLYLWLGALAGLNVPLAATLLMRARHVAMDPTAHVLYHWLAAQAVLSFALAGYLLGRQRDTLDSERCTCQTTRRALNRLVMTDALTGLYNRRYLMEHLAQELNESDRYGTPATCLMLDIDNFKSINDSYGHPFGDFVLTRMARVITNTVRRADIAGRYGGEEFLIIMPRLAPEEALVLAERLRVAVGAQPFLYKGRSVPLTVSIGLAGYRRLPAARRNGAALIEAADQALYTAKRSGRNQCVLWQGDSANRLLAEASIEIAMQKSA